MWMSHSVWGQTGAEEQTRTALEEKQLWSSGLDADCCESEEPCNGFYFKFCCSVVLPQFFFFFKTQQCFCVLKDILLELGPLWGYTAGTVRAPGSVTVTLHPTLLDHFVFVHQKQQFQWGRYQLNPFPLGWKQRTKYAVFWRTVEFSNMSYARFSLCSLELNLFVFFPKRLWQRNSEIFFKGNMWVL